MGLLIDLLTAPIMLPAKGLIFVFDKIREQAENEVLDDGKIRMQLLELQALLDLGEITEEEFYKAEEELLDRLDAILAFKQGIEDEEDSDDEESTEDADG
jgi:hypothetical protein